MENKDIGAEDYVPFDIDDIDTAGAKKVIEAEKAHLLKRPGGHPEQPLSGMAISGGGIRSASFALGVTQALAWKGALGRFDYLSTVSGGSYMGSSLTWFLHKAWKVPAEETHDLPQNCQPETGYVRFGTDGDCFPYGAKERLSKPDNLGVRAKSAVLRHLRQNASYLNPGRGITGASLFAIILRGMLVSAAVYFPILLLGIYLLTRFDLLPLYSSTGSIMNPVLESALYIGGIFVLSAFAYSIGTHFSRVGSNIWYHIRRGYERVAGYALVAIIGLVIIGLLPWIADKGMPLLLSWLGSDPEKATATQFSALISTVAGALLGGKAYKQSEAQAGGKISVDLLAGVGAALLVYGVLISAYSIVSNIGNADAMMLGIFVCLAIGWLTNVNFLSIHRYYRDRLMETFMPGVPEVFKSGTGPSPDADKGYLSKMCNYADSHTSPGIDNSTGPYHIINTNLILVNSKIKKFRSRGGDSFVLSPLYCGSNATGWRSTKTTIEDKLTLATAMAISGAAANPNSGPSGKGASRGKAVSFLMTLLNLRLGYWLPNPGKKSIFGAKPNMLFPGINALFSKDLNETNPFVQLSDGGHFENLALYELIRRKVKIIVCTDGGADKDFMFSDFANMTEKVRVDFGVDITGIKAKKSKQGNWVTTKLNLSALVPQEKNKDAHGHKLAKTGHLLCGVRYPGDPEGEASGLLIYIKTTWLKDLPGDIVGYKNDHPEFPDQSTADQFFDERQFEAYRELGYRITQRVLEDKLVSNLGCMKSDKHEAATEEEKQRPAPTETA